MADVTITLPQEMSATDIAKAYTIGGAAYAQAVSNYVDPQGNYGLTDYMPAGATISLPVEWLGSQALAQAAYNKPKDYSMPLLAAGIIAAVLLIRPRA